VADFSQPGSDGALPEGFKEWHWGVIYTVRPELLAPLARGREYRIVASVRRRVAKDEDFSAYEELYQRAAWAARARIADLTCVDEGEPLHTWVISQSWGCFGEEHRFAAAGIGLGVVFPNAGGPRPEGLIAPDAAELMSPGPLPGVVEPRQIDEIYNEFDVRELPYAHSDIFLFSYGEYVPDHRGMRFDRFVERAEKLAQAHAGAEPLRILKREWMWATNPDVAVVHIHTQVQSLHLTGK